MKPPPVPGAEPSKVKFKTPVSSGFRVMLPLDPLALEIVRAWPWMPKVPAVEMREGEVAPILTLPELSMTRTVFSVTIAPEPTG